jgi:hypothetical protein
LAPEAIRRTGNAGPRSGDVVGPVEVSVAGRRHGRAEPETGVAAIAVAPVSELVAGPADDDPMLDGWSAAPVLAVALDLAQDQRAVVRSSATGA